jgi:hypothetical protein
MKKYIGLVHYPIVNKNKEIVATSVTNLDIHDIARSARTFDFEKYFIITPILEQHKLLARILGHWEQDEASAYNPDRQDALTNAQVMSSIEESIAYIEKKESKKVYVVVTGANFGNDCSDLADIWQQIEKNDGILYLLFGTGWGLAPEIVNNAHFKANPIVGLANDGYNHLSVRSAVAIYCDRLARLIRKN